MKKTYMKPTMRAFKISASTLLAGSLRASDQYDPYMESSYDD